jgi:hypothetical protein
MSAVASLWSPDIRPDALSAFAILEPQAQALARQTKGLLVGELRVAHDDEGKTTRLSLDLIAPLLNNYRRRVLTVTHPTNMIYPAKVDADCFRRNPLVDLAAQTNLFAPFEKAKNEASSDEELQRLVEQVLRSHEVTSLAVSLIARINDVLKEKQAAVDKVPEDAEPQSPEDFTRAERQSNEPTDSPN